MNITVSIIITLVIAWIAISMYRDYQRDKASTKAFVPKLIAMHEVDLHTAQEVYDWMAFATRAVGPSYMRFHNIDLNSRHASLLLSLQHVCEIPNENINLYLRNIAVQFNLDPHVLDLPLN